MEQELTDLDESTGDEPQVYASSRRTIMSGEVVTFATGFKESGGVFGGYGATGPFEVSASRDAVWVHRAAFSDRRSCELLMLAIRSAEVVRETLSKDRQGGAPSVYPAEPTKVNDTNDCWATTDLGDGADE